MVISKHATHFAGKPVVEYELGRPLQEPEKHAWRLRVEYDSEDSMADSFSSLLEDPGVDRVSALVIGAWDSEMVDVDSSAMVEALVAAAPQLPSLTAIFLGDIVYTENEISWIQQSDVSPLWTAYPKLEHFKVRGGANLGLGRLEHDFLKSLTIESGGLSKDILREIAEARLPQLVHLELYLGTNWYGWDGTIEDVKPLLQAGKFPKIRYLGLRDSEIADDIAEAIVSSPILEQLEVLDLSLGTLGDRGGRALLECAAVKKLKKLDLHRHYIPPKMTEWLERLPIDVDVSDRQEPDSDDDRYVAVGE